MKTRKAILSILAILLPTLTLYFTFFSKDQVRKGFESGMTKASKEMILVYQDSYKTEYKQYNTDVAEVRKYFVLDEYVKVFLSRDEIPPDVFSKIGNEDVPYLERERYSILIQIEKKEIEYLSIWKLTQDGILTKIYPKL